MDFLQFTLFMLLLISIPLIGTTVWKATTTTIFDRKLSSLRQASIELSNEKSNEYYVMKEQCYKTLNQPRPPPEQWRDKYNGNTSFSSQFGQDSWAYYALFYRFHENSITGYYVDLAAGMPRYISNTYFFDLCLDWFGLCIEGDPAKKHYFTDSLRTCEFAPVVIDEKQGVRQFTSNKNGLMNGLKPDGQLNSATGELIKVNTSTLSNILNQTQFENVDFFSLDLESYESQALKTLDFSKYKIDVFLIERGDRNSSVYKIMMANNYIYLGSLGKSSNIDYVYIRNNSIWSRHCIWAQLSPPIPTCDFTFDIIMDRFQH